MFSLTAPSLPRFARWSAALGCAAICVVSGSVGCRKPTGHPVSEQSSSEPTALELPRVKKPEPLPAKRVLHVAFTSNVAGEVEPCG